MFYKLFFRVVLSRIPAETAHRWAFAAIRSAFGVPLLRRVLRWLFAPAQPVLRTEALGTVFPSPLGLAAGFDKNAEGVAALAGLGFGFIEVGTVTPKPQPGNPRPRMFRLTADAALINRMGFNNEGAEAVAARLERLPRPTRTERRTNRTSFDGVSVPVGVNIGKNKTTSEADAVADYRSAAERLAPLADYLVVNVSSPNTPGLRELQAVDRLRPVLREVRTASRRPVLVKIAPDLADPDIDAIADLAVDLGLDGIIATNTTVRRSGLRQDPDEAGGLSGAPLAGRSREVLLRLAGRVGDRLVLVSAGGVRTAEDVWDRLACGATLVQIYTSFVYTGPFLMRRLNKEVARRAEREGLPGPPRRVSGVEG